MGKKVYLHKIMYHTWNETKIFPFDFYQWILLIPFLAHSFLGESFQYIGYITRQYWRDILSNYDLTDNQYSCIYNNQLLKKK